MTRKQLDGLSALEMALRASIAKSPRARTIWLRRIERRGIVLTKAQREAITK